MAGDVPCGKGFWSQVCCAGIGAHEANSVLEIISDELVVDSGGICWQAGGQAPHPAARCASGAADTAAWTAAFATSGSLATAAALAARAERSGRAATGSAGCAARHAARAAPSRAGA